MSGWCLEGSKVLPGVFHLRVNLAVMKRYFRWDARGGIFKSDPAMTGFFYACHFRDSNETPERGLLLALYLGNLPTDCLQDK